MISTQKPLSAFATEVLNPPTQARYPCLKNFWKMDDAADGSYAVGSDLTTIADSVGDNDITSSFAGSNIHFTAGDGVKMPTLGGFAEILTNFSFEDKSTVMMWLATREAGFDMRVGPAFINTAGGSEWDDGVNAANTDTGNIATGINEMAILSLDISKGDTSGIEMARVSGTAYTAVTGTKGGVSSAVDLSVYDDSEFTEDASVDDTYGIAMFQFTVLPTAVEMELAAVWMRERWLAGEKVIYPGWLGRN